MPTDRHDHDDDAGDFDAARDVEAEDRAAILRRRAMFVASAIAGLALASCDSGPQPCLDVALPEGGSGGTGGSTGTAGMGGEPQPCLGMRATGGGDTGGAGGSGGMGGSGGAPRPCLDMAPTGGGGAGGTGGM